MAGFYSVPIAATALTVSGTAAGTVGIASVTGWQQGSQAMLTDTAGSVPRLVIIVGITSNLLILQAIPLPSQGWSNSLFSYVQATGTITISGGSGVESVVIGGVESHVTWATSDAATATALISQINTNSGATVTASSGGSGVVTVTANAPGAFGNNVTMVLGATYTGMTLSGLVGGALSGGTSKSATPPPALNTTGNVSDMSAWTTGNSASIAQVSSFIYQNNGVNGPV